MDARETDLERGKAGPKEIGREGIHREKGKEREAEGVHTVHTESRVSVFHVQMVYPTIKSDARLPLEILYFREIQTRTSPNVWAGRGVRSE